MVVCLVPDPLPVALHSSPFALCPSLFALRLRIAGRSCAQGDVLAVACEMVLRSEGRLGCRLWDDPALTGTCWLAIVGDVGLYASPRVKAIGMMSCTATGSPSTVPGVNVVRQTASIAACSKSRRASRLLALKPPASFNSGSIATS